MSYLFIILLSFLGIAGILSALFYKKEDLTIHSNPFPEEEIQDISESETENVPPVDILEHENIINVHESKSIIDESKIPLMIDYVKPLSIINIEQTEDLAPKLNIEVFSQYDYTQGLASYLSPPIDLLEFHGLNSSSVTSEDLDEQKKQIINTLNNFGIQIEKIKATLGPTITLFEIIPAAGIRIATIKNLENDIALDLATFGIKVLGHLPGKGTIGIEVPNKTPDTVSIRSVLSSDRFLFSEMNLPVALGKTMDNEVFVADLSKIPHMLIAGATGQGKSVSINSIIISLIYKKHPSELKFILIDINGLELTLYRNIERHFLAALPGTDAVITKQDKVADTLNALCIEMNLRFDLLSSAHVRNINDYNEKFINRNINNQEKHRYLPYIVVVIDEFSDLISKTDQTIESLISKIAQGGRAIGIHLIISTQRPAISVITGTIKASFSARSAFRVFSKADSWTIIDTYGAENLKGNGDFLYTNGSEIIHLQGTYISTAEVIRVCEFIGNQQGYPSAMQLPKFDISTYSSNIFDSTETDPLLFDAARLIVLYKQASTSLIQRKMKLGYNRAGRIIDQLEAAGIVGPFEGSTGRDLLFSDQYSLEIHLAKIKI